jgi:hypothetical protein
MATPRLMVIRFVAPGLVVAAVAARALRSWLLLVAVLALHGIAIEEERGGDRYQGARAGTS